MAAESGQGGNGTILFGCRISPGGLPRAKPEPAAGPTAAIVMMSRPRQNTRGSQKEIYSVSTNDPEKQIFEEEAHVSDWRHGRALGF